MRRALGTSQQRSKKGGILNEQKLSRLRWWFYNVVIPLCGGLVWLVINYLTEKRRKVHGKSEKNMVVKLRIGVHGSKFYDA